jgi:CBS domain-containing protein
MDKVGSIGRQNAITTHPRADLTSAARSMRENHIGYLIVTELDVASPKERPVGVLTDRDIVISVVAREADPKSLRVEDVMTRNPVVVREDSTLGAAVREMRRIGVRRLPIVDGLGHLVGVLSLDDVLATLASEFSDVAASIQSEIKIERAMRS